jgi:hypothetical protein
MIRRPNIDGDDLAAWIVNQCTVVGECWEWTRARASAGYGVMGFKGSVDCVHRVTYELLRGPIPAGLHIDHLCRNRPCCNPWHLEPVTREENNRRSTQTICRNGHPFSGDNVIWNRNGGRQCRACRNARLRRRRREGQAT